MNSSKNQKALWAVALLFGLIPLLYPGLFHTSTDLLPKRLFLYMGSTAVCFTWLIQHNTTATYTIRSPLTTGATLYVLWNLISLSWSTNAFTGWVEALQLIVLFTIFILTTALNVRQNLQIISLIATLGGLIVSLIGIAQYLGLGFDNILSVGLPSSTFIFRNLAAAYLISVLPLGLYALHQAKTTHHKHLCILSLTSMLLYLFYTRTRGAWVALACATLLLCVVLILSQPLRETAKNLFSNLWHTSPSRWLLLTSFALLTIGITLPAQTSKTVIQQFDEQKSTATTAVTSLLTPGSDRGRFTMWHHTGNMIKDHPIIGVGLDNWEYIYPLYDQGEKITFSSEPVRPHNDFLWITSELGIIGLMLYLAMLFLAAQSIYKLLTQNNTNTSLLAIIAIMGLTSHLVYSLFSFPKEQPTPALFFWFYLGLINVTLPAPKEHKQTIIPLLGILACLCAFYISIRHIQFDQHYQTARAYESRQQWQPAFQAISQALEAGTFDHRAKFLKAQYLQKMGKYDTAATAYLDALKAHPNYAHSHHNLGGVYAARGNLNQAIPSFKRALEIRPTYHQAGLHLGNAYVATKQFDLAQQVFNQILTHNPQSSEAHTNLGAVYLRQEKYEQAIQSFRNALEIQPQNAQAHNNLAYAYEQTGQLSQAIRAYENLLKHWQGDIQYVTTVRNRILTLRRQIERQK